MLDILLENDDGGNKNEQYLLMRTNAAIVVDIDRQQYWRVKEDASKH